MAAERRCPSCGALVSEDAEWCGQCFAPLREPEHARRPAASAPAQAGRPQAADAGVAAAAEPAQKPAGSGEAPVAPRRPSWTCPVCAQENPIDVDPCSVCGTPFARLFEEKTERPDVPPGRALVWSLVYPGLGHRLVGRGGEGFVRAALFTWMLGTALLLLLGRGGQSIGPLASMLVFFGGAALAVYVFSAIETARLAQGGDTWLTGRQIMWIAVAMIGISVLLATVLVLSSSRGG